MAIVTNAGGPGVIATDELIARGGELPKLSALTVDELNRMLPPYWSKGNPIDVLGDATAERFTSALNTVLSDSEVDGALVMLTPQAMMAPSDVAASVVDAARTSRCLRSGWEETPSPKACGDSTRETFQPTPLARLALDRLPKDARIDGNHTLSAEE